MAVDQVTRMWSKRRADISTTDRKKYVAVQSDAYQVTVTDPTTTIATILSHADVPKAGDLLAPASSLYCRKVSPQQVSPIMWVVSVTWQGDTGPDGLADSPLDQPPEIDWSDVESSEPADEDFNGKPIVTVNGEPITGVTIPIVDQILTVKRNFASINTFAIAPYRQATNSDIFAGWAPGTVRLIKYNAKVKNSTDDVQNTGPSPQPQAYWEVTASFQFRYPYRTTNERAWYARVRHEGLVVRDSSGRLTRATVSGADATKPVLLKLDGTIETNPDNATWLEFQRLGSLPFNSLGLLS